MRSIQGRLGSKRRMAEERSITPDAKAHRGRDRKEEDDSRLDGKENTGSMLPVWKKGALHE